MSAADYYGTAKAILRATPAWVAYTSAATRTSSTGAALTPDNTADGDIVVGLDWRTAGALPDLVSGGNEIFVGGLTAGSGASGRIWWKAIGAGETIPAAANATRRVLMPIRNADLTSPIVGSASSITTGTTGAIPALGTFGEQYLALAGYIHDNATAVRTLSAPLVQRNASNPTNSPGVGADSDGLVASLAAQNFTITADAFIGVSIALRGKVV